MATKKTQGNIHTYHWVGINHQGHKTTGDIEATSPKLARMLLRQRGIRLKKLTKERAPLFSRATVRNRDIVILTRQLATLVEGGIPIAESITAVANSSDNIAVKKLLARMRNSVAAGENFTNTVRQHPDHFNPLYIGLVNVGEESGTLGPMLKRIATYLEKAEALRAKIKAALTYPVVVLILGVLIASGLLIFIIPQFKELFESFGADLPALTEHVIQASEYMQANFLKIVAACFAVAYVHRKLYKSSPGVKLTTDKLILKIPVFGELIQKGILARIARTISIMFRAGIPMIETLSIIGPAAGNQIYVNALAQVKREVSTGQPLENSMREAQVFPSMILQMVKTGEETGEMDAMLDRAADFYEDEVDNMVAAISSLVEPMLIVVLGVLIGVVVVAMYLPIFNLASVF